jgi:hypothetical protein
MKPEERLAPPMHHVDFSIGRLDTTDFAIMTILLIDIEILMLLDRY